MEKYTLSKRIHAWVDVCVHAYRWVDGCVYEWMDEYVCMYVCPFPRHGWTQHHIHRGICTGDLVYFFCPTVSMKSLFLTSVVMAALSLFIFCAHDASVCSLVALASLAQLFHTEQSEPLWLLVPPKTLAFDLSSCSHPLAAVSHL